MANPKGNPQNFMKKEFKYKHVEDLEAAIAEYFESCWETKWVENKKTGEWKMLTDHEGTPILEQVRPYTISGMAVHLGLSRMGLHNYKARPEFKPVLEKAKNVCEAYLEEGMLKGKVPAIPGIFNAKNNYGWKDKSELNVSTEVVEMPMITKDGEALEFDIGTAITSQPT
jgi:hypothetical protein